MTPMTWVMLEFKALKSQTLPSLIEDCNGNMTALNGNTSNGDLNE